MIETIGQDLIEVVSHLQEENKRYREALENIKIYLETSNVPTDDKPLMMTDTLKTIDQALRIKP